MNDKYMTMVFKIGVLLIGIAFLVVYLFHSHNGRFHMIENDKDSLLTYKILDTRTGIIYHSITGKDEGPKFLSMNITNGKVKLYDMDRTGEWKHREPELPLRAAPPAPGAPPSPSAQDFLKGKK